MKEVCQLRKPLDDEDAQHKRDPDVEKLLLEEIVVFHDYSTIYNM
jgi:hypothetical protein